jgi:YVTN family beta-propeller protein
VFDARPPFSILKTINTGPITNHVNIAHNAKGTFAYVTVGGLNQVQVFRTDDFSKIATIPVGKLPHGIWPSGDGTRVYVGLENEDRLVAINTLTNKMIASSPTGQAPQAITYVPNAVPNGYGTHGLQPLGLAGNVTRLSLVQPPPQPNHGRAIINNATNAPTSISLFHQGLYRCYKLRLRDLSPNIPTCLLSRSIRMARVQSVHCSSS